jgi:hypothetical protein
LPGLVFSLNYFQGATMKKTVAILAMAAIAGGAVYAAGMRTHNDRKAKFTIQYPATWSKKVNTDGINLALASKDNLANVQVMRSDVEADTPTDTFLAEVEKAAGPGHVNKLPEDKRSASAEDLGTMNAEQGTAGYYDLDYNGVKVHQIIMAIRKGASMYSIIVTFADQGAAQYKDVCTKIADSFKISK